MPKGLIEHSTLTAIADAIREKAKSNEAMLPSEMAGLIAGLGGGMTVLSGTVIPSGKVGMFQTNCALPEADFMWLHIEPVATISESSTSLVSHVNYFVNDGVTLAKSVWGGKTRSATGSEQLTIDHENGIVSSPWSGSTVSFVVTYSSKEYNWWYVYG